MFAWVFTYINEGVLTAVSVSDGEEIRVSNMFPSCTESVCASALNMSKCSRNSYYKGFYEYERVRLSYAKTGGFIKYLPNDLLTIISKSISILIYYKAF